MNNLKMMRRPEVQRMTGLSCSGIYAMMQSNTFPKAIKLGERSVGWLEHEVQAWLENRVAATRQGGM
jgi:prophage regulatory protein